MCCLSCIVIHGNLKENIVHPNVLYSNNMSSMFPAYCRRCRRCCGPTTSSSCLVVFCLVVSCRHRIGGGGGGGGNRFRKGVTFDANSAEQNGGAFAVTGNGSVAFNRPQGIRVRDNNALVGVQVLPRMHILYACKHQISLLARF